MENGNRNKDIQEKKTFANYKNIDIITDIMYLLRTYRAFAVMILTLSLILCRKIQIASKTTIRRKL